MPTRFAVELFRRKYNFFLSAFAENENITELERKSLWLKN